MTEISDAAQTKWNDLVKQANFDPCIAGPRLVQQVSDEMHKVNAANRGMGIRLPPSLAPYILPKPVDPLAAALAEIFSSWSERDAERVREALAKHGLQITETHSDR